MFFIWKEFSLDRWEATKRSKIVSFFNLDLFLNTINEVA
jgi:hypothetical protein